MPIEGKVNTVNYPLPVLTILEKFIEEISSDYNINLVDSGYPIIIEPLNNQHTFYFSIESIKTSKNQKFKIEYIVEVITCPFQQDGRKEGTSFCQLEDIMNKFYSWKIEYEKYNQPSILNNDLTLQYQKEYLVDFLIKDEDAEKAAFSHQQQHFLSDYLNNMVKEIGVYQNESNKEQIEEIIKETQALVQSISSETKNGFMRRLTFIWSKTKKTSINAADYFTTQFIDYVTEKGIDKMVHFTITQLIKSGFYYQATKMILENHPK